MLVTLVNHTYTKPPQKWLVISGDIVDPALAAFAHMVNQYPTVHVWTERIVEYEPGELEMINEFTEATNR